MMSMAPHRTTEVASAGEIGTARRIVADAAMKSMGDQLGPDVALVVSELVTNALEHGDDGIVSVEYGPTRGGFEISVASPSWGTPTRSNEPVSPANVHGRGLRIVTALADAVAVTSDHGTVTVRCRFNSR